MDDGDHLDRMLKNAKIDAVGKSVELGSTQAFERNAERKRTIGNRSHSAVEA